jgi:CRP-like cAMP-binding protein
MISPENLRIFNLFMGLDKSDLEKITRLCTRNTYDKDTVILNPNSSSSEIFMVENGHDSVQIEIPIAEHESKLVIHTLKKGETFGWASLGPSHPRTALARCLEKVDIIRINSQDLLKLLDQNSHMGYVVMRNLSGIISERLNYTTTVLRRFTHEWIQRKESISPEEQ